MPSDAASVGVAHHNGWAVLVTVAPDGALLDRRRVELVDADLPSMPHHHDAQGLPPEQADALVERVRASARRHAPAALAALASAVSAPIRGIAIIRCPPLPPTTAERISNYRAQAVADSVMYRMALAEAAESRGWLVHWYDAKRVLPAARDLLAVDDLDAHFRRIRESIGPPWRADHKLAMAAAIVAAAREAPG